MVIIVESRVERYKKQKVKKKHRRQRTIIFIISVVCFFYCLYTVDVALRQMMCINDKRIYGFEVDHEVYTLQFLGDDYVVSKEQIEHSVDKIMSKTKRIYYIIDDYKNKLLDE